VPDGGTVTFTVQPKICLLVVTYKDNIAYDSGATVEAMVSFVGNNGKMALFED